MNMILDRGLGSSLEYGSCWLIMDKVKKEALFLNLVWKTFPQKEFSLNPYYILFDSHVKASLNIPIHLIISDFYEQQNPY